MEDPAPGFVRLRDAVDVSHCRSLGAATAVPTTPTTVAGAATGLPPPTTVAGTATSLPPPTTVAGAATAPPPPTTVAGAPPARAPPAPLTEDDVAPLSAEAMASAQARTKLTPAQITLAHDVGLFARLGPGTPKGVVKKFRLMVKRRLNKDGKEVLSGMADKAERQAWLAEKFEEYEERMKGLVGSGARA